MKKLVLVVLLACFALPANAQDWPTRPVSLVVAYAPGSATDVLARILAPSLSEQLGQQVIVENVGGAGGTIGSVRVMHAVPDGYQFVLGTVGTHAQNQLLSKNPPCNAATDFAPVALIAELPFVMIARNNLPVNGLQEFAAYVKANQSKLQFGSAGTGSAGHLACALFNAMIGAEVTHVPYRGSAQAMQDLIGGLIAYQCAVASVVKPQIEGRVVKAIAILAKERSASQPDVPSTGGQGMPEFTASTWDAFFLPKATPTPIVRKLNAAIVAALDSPNVRARFKDIGADVPSPERRTPEYLGSFVRSEIEKWKGPIKASGVSVD